MAKKNFYAVKVGKNTGIFKTWAECSDSVTGFNGAVYKGFATQEEAEEFLKVSKDKNNSGVNPGTQCEIDKTNKELKAIVNNKATTEKLDKNTNAIKFGYDVTPIRSQAKVISSKAYIKPEKIQEDYEFIAFVDGSYNSVTKIYGAGVIVLNIKDGSYDTYCKAGHDEWDQWNIVGELEAAKLALTKAQELGVKNVAIYHDLKNISLWATGEWKAKNKYTQEYVKFIETMSTSLNICFIKVKGHSDESIFNDLADEAAKKAILEYKRI